MPPPPLPSAFAEVPLEVRSVEIISRPSSSNNQSHQINQFQNQTQVQPHPQPHPHPHPQSNTQLQPPILYRMEPNILPTAYSISPHHSPPTYSYNRIQPMIFSNPNNNIN